MSTSNNSNITIFNFEEWLKDHGLSQYKQIFIDVNMTDLANLDVTNESFARLITDSRLNGDQQIIQHIIKSIQSLHHKSSDVHKLTEKTLHRLSGKSNDSNHRSHECITHCNRICPKPKCECWIRLKNYCQIFEEDLV